MQFTLQPYCPALRPDWDALVEAARQGTFLFQRSFMDYHSARFADCSLLFYAGDRRVVAAFPACRMGDAEVVSHAGLTYGGLLTLPSVGAATVLDMYAALKAYYKQSGVSRLVVKPVPWIYHRYPAEEEQYALFRQGAVLSARAVSSVVDLSRPLPLSTLRRRCCRKAERTGLLSLQSTADHLPAYWQLLTETLAERHGVRPVHSLSEIQLLLSRHPSAIRLVTATKPVGDTMEVVAGCLLFLCPPTVHVQYIAAGAEGRSSGALDLLFARLIDHFAACQAEFRYFDFGISTEEGGLRLNEGLLFQKEGFGGRAVCYDAYTLVL